MNHISRSDAKAAGLQRFFTGKPCKHGHVAERLVSDARCVVCTRHKGERRLQRNPERVRALRKAVRDKWNLANPDKVVAHNRRRREKWKIDHPDRVRKNVAKRAKRYAIRHPDRVRISRSRYRGQRRGADFAFKLTCRLRERLWAAVRRNAKGGSAVRDLGCTIAAFKQYIETQFASGMSWENWGTHWQLDHIKPVGGFDLTDRSQFLEACHYTNLRPLSIAAHKEKSAREKHLKRQR